MNIQEYINNLKRIEKNLNNLEWGKRVGNDDSVFPHKPTSFMYEFCLFNSLYGVNWEESYTKNQIVLWGDKTYENDKQYALLKRINIEERKLLYQQIHNEISNETISTLDINSNNIPYRTVRYFISALQVDENEFIKTTSAHHFNCLEDMVYFLYKVRNNIFHGIKDFSEIEQPAQSARLELYGKLLRMLNATIIETLSNEARSILTADR